MQRTQRFDFKNTSQALEKDRLDDIHSDNPSYGDQQEERKASNSCDESAEMDSNESEIENNERDTGRSGAFQPPAEGFYNMVEYSQQDSEEE